MTAASTAFAEEARFPVERFRPAIDASGVIDVDSGAVGEPFAWSAGAYLNYALNPLVLRNDEGRVGALVAHRVGLDVVGSLSLFHWVEFGVDVPALVFQARDTAELTSTVNDAQDLQAVALGDVRMLAKIRILRAREQFVDLALIPAITVPSGSLTSAASGNYVGEGQITFAPELAISKELGDGPMKGIRLAGNVGYRLRPEERKVVNVTIGHELTYRAGVRYPLGFAPAAISVSASGGTYAFQPFSSGFEENPLEVLVAGDYDLLPFLKLEGGVGKGILSGFGTPDFRAFVGLRFSSLPSPDRDGDGILNEDDQCPDDAEDKDGFEDGNGCPDLDDDGDGVNDVDDKCPRPTDDGKSTAEDRDGFEDADGCPDDDNDGDGINDGDDACPDKPGPKDNKGCPWPDEDGDGIRDGDDKCPSVPGTKELEGCPPPKDTDGDGIIDGQDVCPEEPGMKALRGCPDKDGDGFIDKEDKCPDEPETVNNYQDDDGCPDKGKTQVKLTKEKIEILDKIYFQTGKDIIQSRSFPLLDQIATILKTHPELTKVRIAGHTDSDGSDKTNDDLSDRRAKSVKRALVERGVDAGRLDGVGYGERLPVVPNTSKTNKATNRRVEFVIVELDGKPQEDAERLAPGAITSPATSTTTDEKAEEKQP